MSHKEAVLDCLKSINSILTDNSGAVVFNPNVYIIEKVMNKFQKFISLCVSNIRCIFLMDDTKKHTNFYNPSIAFAVKKEDTVVINLNAFAKNGFGLYYKNVRQNLGEGLDLQFMMYHECAHLFEDKHWKKEIFKSNTVPKTQGLCDILEGIYLQHINETKKLYDMPTVEWSKKSKIMYKETDYRLCKTVYHQTNESWADCFSLMMIYKTFGRDAFSKTIDHVIWMRENDRSFKFLNSIALEDGNEWLSYNHNTAQALLKLKRKVIEPSFVPPTDLNWDVLKEAVNGAVTQAVAQDLYQVYMADEDVQKTIDLRVQEYNKSNMIKTVSHQLPLFEGDEETVEMDFDDLCEPWWDNVEMSGLNNGVDVANNIKQLIDRGDFFDILNTTSPEKYNQLLNLIDLKTCGHEGFGSFYISILQSLEAIVPLFKLEKKASEEDWLKGKLKIATDYTCHQKHIDALIDAQKTVLNSSSDNSLKELPIYENPMAGGLHPIEEKEEKPSLTLKDKIFQQLSKAYYFEPEKIKIKP